MTRHVQKDHETKRPREANALPKDPPFPLISTTTPRSPPPPQTHSPPLCHPPLCHPHSWSTSSSTHSHHSSARSSTSRTTSSRYCCCPRYCCSRSHHCQCFICCLRQCNRGTCLSALTPMRKTSMGILVITILSCTTPAAHALDPSIISLSFVGIIWGCRGLRRIRTI